MPSIRVDEDVYDMLQRQAVPFVDSPNSVLRRLLKLDGEQRPSLERRPSRSRVAGARTSAAEGLETAAPQKRQRKPSTHKAPSRTLPRRPKGKRISSGVLLPLEAYIPVVLDELRKRGGVAPAGEVIEAVGARLGEMLSPEDRERTRTGNIRWVNRVQFARQRLVEQGALRANTQRGIWELANR